MVLVKSVQSKIDSYRITASSKADGGRTSVGYHQTISGRGIGREVTIVILHARKFFRRICFLG